MILYGSPSALRAIENAVERGRFPVTAPSPASDGAFYRLDAIKVLRDEFLPPGVVEFRDADGRVLGRIEGLAP